MIREATHDDIPRLIDLGRTMHAESPTFSRLAFDPGRLAGTIEHVLGSPRGFAWVAEADDQVVGGMLALVTPHWFSSELAACDLALFVDPAHRGGMGAARLLRAYVAWAHEQGAKLVQFGIVAGVNVDHTQALCERLGWRRAGVVMEV